MTTTDGVRGSRFRRPPRDRRRRSDRGAAAIEFALVSTVVFPVLFGIMQYGMYFNDSMAVRQGTREAARQGVVENFVSCGGATTNSGKLACVTKQQMGGVTSKPYVKISAPSGWAVGNSLVVCAMVKTAGTFGFIPMPRSGWTNSITQMSIESDAQKASWTSYSDTLPSGVSWPSGC